MCYIYLITKITLLAHPAIGKDYCPIAFREYVLFHARDAGIAVACIAGHRAARRVGHGAAGAVVHGAACELYAGVVHPCGAVSE